MKRVLSTLTGGLPFTLDELETIQDNVKTLTAGVGKGLAIGETTVKVEGIVAVITGSGGPAPTADISTGLFWYLDELYLFDAVVSLALPSGMTDATFATDFEFDLAETTNTTVTFNDASSKDIVQLRKAVLTQTPTTWAGLTYGGAFSLIDNIHDKFPDATDVIKGKIEITTQAEANALSDTTKAITPATIPITSETQQGVIEIATQAEVNGGIDTTRAVTPKTLEDSILYTTVELDINGWDMDSVATVNVAHGLGSNRNNIRKIDVMILDDSGDLTGPLNKMTIVAGPADGSISSINTTNIVLRRTLGGGWDTTTYDDDAINRGYITIEYLKP